MVQKIEDIMNRSIKYLVLLLTTECNLSCSYCYRGKKNSVRKMSPDTAERALTLAASGGHTFHVQLSGGEPCLEPELIEKVATMIRRKDMPATIGVQTNATLIDNAMVEMFKRYHVQVGVSLDGTPEVHDLVRGSSRATIRGLYTLSDKHWSFRVTTVVHDRNVLFLDRLALMLASFPVARGIGLDLLVLKGEAAENHIEAPSPEDLNMGLEKLLKALSWINKKRSWPIELREAETLRRAFLSGGMPCFCHASMGEALAVDPDGSLYPCAQAVGDPDFFCGTLDFPDTRALHKVGNYTLGSEDCQDCPIARFCPGDCPIRIYYNPDHIRRLACVMYRKLWEHVRRYL